MLVRPMKSNKGANYGVGCILLGIKVPIHHFKAACRIRFTMLSSSKHVQFPRKHTNAEEEYAKTVLTILCATILRWLKNVSAVVNCNNAASSLQHI